MGSSPERNNIAMKHLHRRLKTFLAGFDYRQGGIVYLAEPGRLSKPRPA
jgi:hypothetical protein